MKPFDVLDLKNNTIHIWVGTFDDEVKGSNKYFGLLSEDEKLRASRFRFNKDRECYVIARTTLRLLLGAYLDIAPKEITFKYSEFGKPSYLQNVELDFNVSHSGNRIIIGFSREQTIGVDIEKIKTDFDPLNLAKNFFSREEIAALSQTKESDMFRAFYRCWTRKESFIKAVGEGLSYPLDSFAVTMDNDRQARFLKIDNTQDSKKDWRLHSFVPGEGYIAAITTDGNPEKIEYFDANDFISWE